MRQLAAVLAAFAILLVAAPHATAAELVRKDAKDLTAAERRTFVRAVLALKRMPSPYRGAGVSNYYDLFVAWHRDAFRCPGYTAHMSPSFLPWHRYYLRVFEHALAQAAGRAIAIPYWDWTNPASTRAVFRDDFMGPNGDPDAGGAVTRGAFRKGRWRFAVVDPPAVDPVRLRHLTRNFGTLLASTPPPRADVLAALDVGAYDAPPFDDQPAPERSFRNALEGWRDEVGEECRDGWVEPLPQQDVQVPHEMHNRVHLWVAGQTPVAGVPSGPVAGTMANNTSPNDPVFWLHHANVDRIWESWIARHGKRYVPRRGFRRGQALNDPMTPFARWDPSATPARQLDLGRLGYRYARLVRGPRATGSASGRPLTEQIALSPPSLRFSCRLPV